MSGVKHSDVDVAMFYDAFTIVPVMGLEATGFCKPGEGGAFVSGGRTAPGGPFPLNTNGGGLSYTHSGMYGMFTLTEAVRQLRGECGRRVTRDRHLPRTGGMFSASATSSAGLRFPDDRAGALTRRPSAMRSARGAVARGMTIRETTARGRRRSSSC
jgi:acetyl-CoA acetyltransferase